MDIKIKYKIDLFFFLFSLNKKKNAYAKPEYASARRSHRI